MGFLVGIEIDNSRIAWVQDSGQAPSRLIRLTTISDNQNRAELRLYLKTPTGKALLCTETLAGIPPMRAGEPSIDIKTAVRKRRLLYKVYLNGSLVKEGSVSLKKYSKTKKPLFLLLLIPIAAVIFFLQTCGDRDQLEKPAIIQAAPEEAPADQETVSQPVAVAEDEPEQAPSTEPAASEGRETVDQPEQAPAPEAEISTIELSESLTIYFPPDSSSLTSEAKEELRNFISRLPEPGSMTESNLALTIEGHCARYGTEEGRADLSEERAENTNNYIRSSWKGEAFSKITGSGATEPVTLDREEQFLNRRVHIELKGTIIKEISKN